MASLCRSCGRHQVSDRRMVLPHRLAAVARHLTPPSPTPLRTVAALASSGATRLNTSSQMEYRRLGRSGLDVSVLGYGATSYESAEAAIELVRECLAHGITFFDCAEAYSDGEAERLLGEAFAALQVPRSDIVVSTKLFKGGDGPNEIGLSRKHILEGTRASLDRLGLDYLDMVLAHRPDDSTPMEEIVRAFNMLLDQNLALYWVGPLSASSTLPMRGAEPGVRGGAGCLSMEFGAADGGLDRRQRPGPGRPPRRPRPVLHRRERRRRRAPVAAQLPSAWGRAAAGGDGHATADGRVRDGAGNLRTEAFCNAFAGRCTGQTLTGSWRCARARSRQRRAVF